MKKAVLINKSQIKGKEYSDLKGYSLNYLMRTTSKIPKVPGVYIWRFWPKIDISTDMSVLDSLNKISESFPVQTEQLVSSHNIVDLTRTFVSNRKSSGIDLSDKKIELLESIQDSEINNDEFLDFFNLLFFHLPPLYIGKANNLNSRLQDHFDRKTQILSDIEKSSLNFEDITISFYEINNSSEKVNELYEILFQKFTHPIFSKRYG